MQLPFKKHLFIILYLLLLVAVFGASTLLGISAFKNKDAVDECKAAGGVYVRAYTYSNVFKNGYVCIQAKVIELKKK